MNDPSESSTISSTRFRNCQESTEILNHHPNLWRSWVAVVDPEVLMKVQREAMQSLQPMNAMEKRLAPIFSIHISSISLYFTVIFMRNNLKGFIDFRRLFLSLWPVAIYNFEILLTMSIKLIGGRRSSCWVHDRRRRIKRWIPDLLGKQTNLRVGECSRWSATTTLNSLRYFLRWRRRRRWWRGEYEEKFVLR